MYRFGSFVLDTRRRTLSREGTPVPLTPKAFDVLVVMLQNPHRVITKEELLKAVWSDAFVEEGNLTQHVSLLRKALAEKSGPSRMIVTIARKGYQFTADVAEVEAPAPVEAAPAPVEVAPAVAEARAEEGEAPAVLDPGRPATLDAGRAGVAVAALAPVAPISPRPSDRRPRRRLAMGLVALAACVAVAGAIVWRTRGDAGPAPGAGRVMLAVLPFRNLTGDPAQEYLADGLTEELTSRLARLHPARLGVIARTSVMAYKNTPKRLDQIGRELSVQYALESSVRRGGDRLRITVQLVKTSDQSHVWSEDYDRPLEDFLDVQAEVAKAVAREVQLRLTQEQQDDLSRHRSIDPGAYEAFLRGRFLWNLRTERGFRAAIAQFEAAIAKAPMYAEAYAGLADAYLLLGGYGYESQSAVMPKAKAAAMRAIALDGRLADPYTTLGLIALQYDWNWAESEMNFQRAIQLNPNGAVAHHFYGDAYLAMAGRIEEAIAQVRTAHALDPRSPIIATDLGRLLVLGGHHAEAMELLRKVLAMSPAAVKVHYEMAKAYRMQGAYAEALAELDQVDLGDQKHLVIAERGFIYALQGRRQQALEAVGEVQEIAQRQHVDPRVIAYIHFALGDEEAGFAALEKGYRDHAHELVMMKTDPGLKAIRAHPRFVELTRRLGLP